MENDLISRQAAIDAINNAFDRETLLTGFVRSIAVRAIRDMPSAQSLIIHCTDCEDWHERQSIFGFAISELPTTHAEPLSDAYMKAVWTWLLDYQIKMAELKGRYAPYEVLSWVANDWRKEHERFNKQTGGD